MGSDTKFGRIVLVRTPYVDGQGTVGEIWHAAIDDDAAAIEAIEHRVGATPGVEVSVVERLSPQTVEALGLNAGDIKQWT